MTIKTSLLSELPEEQALSYIKQIAKWHFLEWGKYLPDSSEEGWEVRLLEDRTAPEKITIIATDESNYLIGSVSLKIDYMKEAFPYFSPWLSGLYVSKDSRGKGISGLLINHLAEIAHTKGFHNIYVFTHDLSLEQYYKKLGWSLIEAQSGEPYQYRSAPILLLKADTEKVLLNTSKYNSISEELPATRYKP